MKLTLPLPPNRANAREHWRVTHRNEVAYFVDAIEALYNAVPSVYRASMGGMSYAFPPLIRPTLTATLYTWNSMDPDNRTARLKLAIDSLVKYGLLVDDSEKHLDFTQIPKQVIDRKNMRVEIELTPCVT